MRVVGAAPLLLALVSPLGSQTTPDGPADAATPLPQVCERLRHGPNNYFSDGVANEVATQLAVPGESAKPPEEQAALLGVQGRELMKLGQPAQAVEALERAFAIVEAKKLEGGVREAVLWHLALAHLQLAEDQNCVEHRNADRCLLPVRPGGVHTQATSTRRAGDLFLRYVQEHPRDVRAGWLLNLTRRLSGDFPEGVPLRMRLAEDKLAPEEAFPEWRDMAHELGIDADDLAGGAVMDDFDGDGFLDLVSSTWDPCDHLKAWRNDGKGGFEDVTRAWGLQEQLGGLNLMQVDYDNDGRLDLLVLRGAWLLTEGRIHNSLLRNVRASGKATKPGQAVAGTSPMRFEDVTAQAGLLAPAYPTQAASWGDADNDGDLDLYVGNESTQASHYPSQLFVNQGDGTFVDVAAQAGVTDDRYAKAVAWGDADNDGDLDLYVSNFGANRLYRNDTPPGKPLRFVDVAPELGVTEPEPQSFATWFFDYDNDGDLDLFAADYRTQSGAVAASYFGFPSDTGQPLLYRNDLEKGAGLAFTEVSRSVGLTRPAMPMGANYGDLDNDGWLDIYLGTGEPDLASLFPNQVYRNHQGRFSEVTFAGRFAHLQKGHGIAFGDVDNDGDQDVFHQLGGFYPGDSFGNALLINPLNEGLEPGKRPHWLVLQLRGKKANSFGVGARVSVRVRDADGERQIHLVAGSGGSFGASSLQLEIGLGAAEAITATTIRWPGSGTVQTLEGLERDRVYRVVEGEAATPVRRVPVRLNSTAK